MPLILAAGVFRGCWTHHSFHSRKAGLPVGWMGVGKMNPLPPSRACDSLQIHLTRKSLQIQLLLSCCSKHPAHILDKRGSNCSNAEGVYIQLSPLSLFTCLLVLSLKIITDIKQWKCDFIFYCVWARILLSAFDLFQCQALDTKFEFRLCGPILNLF